MRPPTFCLWLTGLPSAGKTTIARHLVALLTERGYDLELLDGDEVRRGLSADLGYDRASREAHARRITFVAKLLARHGVIPVVALISPYAASRQAARQEIGRFVEVHVATPIQVCEERDVKRLYRMAREGKLHGMTGVDDPYEPPEHPEIRLDTLGQTPQDSARWVVKELERGGWLSPPSGP